jgi:hypothetical protein
VIFTYKHKDGEKEATERELAYCGYCTLSEINADFSVSVLWVLNAFKL